jgi:hypothetical protein
MVGVYVVTGMGPGQGVNMDYEGHSAMNSMLEQIQLKADGDFHRDNPVVAAFESLGSYVKKFEDELDADHEIGARLVSFGNSITIHVQGVGYSAPSLLTFTGVTEKGDKVKLIQHVTQLSFLLVALPKIGATAYRVGFIWDK